MRWTGSAASLACTMLLVLVMGSGQAGLAEAGHSQSLAFLGLTLLNDNEQLDPTSNAERQRSKGVEALFTKRVADSGQFHLVPISESLAAKIAAGRPPGACNGCEVAYAKEAGAEQVAWISVQKVSNLILNMNLFVGDVASNKLTFVHSVDIRGNTDESWQRSLNYLLDNYLFAAPTQ